MSKSDPTRNCIKCGREVALDESMCDVCLRAGMVPPSPSQYHGTIAVGIIAAVAGLALLAGMSLRGVGPYRAEVVAAIPEPDGVAITVSVANEGTREGRAKCRVVARDEAGRLIGSLHLLSGQIAGGEALTVESDLPGLVAVPEEIEVTCQ